MTTKDWLILEPHRKDFQRKKLFQEKSRNWNISPHFSPSISYERINFLSAQEWLFDKAEVKPLK